MLHAAFGRTMRLSQNVIALSSPRGGGGGEAVQGSSLTLYCIHKPLVITINQPNACNISLYLRASRFHYTSEERAVEISEYCDGMRSACLGAGRVGGKGGGQEATKEETEIGDQMRA